MVKRLGIIEMAFKDWLDTWMVAHTRYWQRLSIWERDVIIKQCWNDYLENIIRFNKPTEKEYEITVTKNDKGENDGKNKE